MTSPDHDPPGEPRLLPCPWQVDQTKPHQVYMDMRQGSVEIGCRGAKGEASCHLGVFTVNFLADESHIPLRERAIAAWNRRPPSPESREVIPEASRAALVAEGFEAGVKAAARACEALGAELSADGDRADWDDREGYMAERIRALQSHPTTHTAESRDAVLEEAAVVCAEMERASIRADKDASLHSIALGQAAYAIRSLKRKSAPTPEGPSMGDVAGLVEALRELVDSMDEPDTKCAYPNCSGCVRRRAYLAVCAALAHWDAQKPPSSPSSPPREGVGAGDVAEWDVDWAERAALARARERAALIDFINSRYEYDLVPGDWVGWVVTPRENVKDLEGSYGLDIVADSVCVDIIRRIEAGDHLTTDSPTETPVAARDACLDCGSTRAAGVPSSSALLKAGWTYVSTRVWPLCQHMDTGRCAACKRMHPLPEEIAKAKELHRQAFATETPAKEET